MQTIPINELVGQTLGNYRVERLMGQGRLSAVYLAQNMSTGMEGALTLFIVPERFSAGARTRFIERFRNEATALVALQHPHLLPVHEYGEYQGYPYLVTPYMMNGSLADVLKQQGRCEPSYVLDILEQVVAGLEYAHRKGVIHGTLRPSNIVLGSDQKMLVAGFGLMHMLQMRGVEQSDRAYGHLFSIADTFLAAPEYIAPEVVQGQAIDKRSDIYALGIILFELLSGKAPFTGANPLDVAKMHVQDVIPSLRTLDPHIPIALVSVVNQALDRDPARRFQSVAELAEAFAQVSIATSEKRPSTSPLVRNDNAQETPDGGYATGSWQFMPPIMTGKIPAINIPVRDSAAASPKVPVSSSSDSWQLMPPIVTGHLESVSIPVRPEPPVARKAPVSPPVPQEPPVRPRVIAPPTLVSHASEPLVSVKPAPVSLVSARPAPAPQMEQRVSLARESRSEEKSPEWWTTQSVQEPMVLGTAPDPWGNPDTAWSGSATPTPAKRSRPAGRSSRNAGMGRRKVIALLATGGVVAAGIAIGINLNLGNQSKGTAAVTTAPQGATQTGNTAAKTTQQTQGQTAATGNTAPTTTPKAPTTAGHTGTAIGMNTMALNTSVKFNNDQDLLIHLPNGNFVAYNRACTHQQVLVNYDPGSHTIVCPAHGAVFDPTNGNVLQPPAPSPLTTVKVKVNTDGAITMI